MKVVAVWIAYNIAILLAWIVPIIGLVFGPGPWWLYLLWIALGTVALLLFSAGIDRMNDDDD